MRKIALATLVMLATVTGCSWFSSATKNAETAAIDCGKQDLGQTVATAAVSLIMDVVTIVATGGADWQADLDALGAKFGPDALACAEKVAEAVFRTPLDANAGAAGSAATGDAAVMQAAHARVQMRLAGKVFK